MVHIFICIDLDRDYAVPIRNYRHAVSDNLKNKSEEITSNPELSVSLKGTIEGFHPLISYFKDNKLPATFYHETRSLTLFSKHNQNLFNNLKLPTFEHGLHGYDHEDLTGEETKIYFSRDEEHKLLKNGKEEVENLLSTDVYGFRAPYMKLSSNTIEIISKLNFIYDSSIYMESESGISPNKINEDIFEFPVIKTPKDSIMKGMYTYLWPLFEGKRSKEETIRNYLQIYKNTEIKKSYISINLHSWHFAYLISESRYLLKDEIQKNIDYFAELIRELEKKGAIFSTPMAWLKENNLL